ACCATSLYSLPLKRLSTNVSSIYSTPNPLFPGKSANRPQCLSSIHKGSGNDNGHFDGFFSIIQYANNQTHGKFPLTSTTTWSSHLSLSSAKMPSSHAIHVDGS